MACGLLPGRIAMGRSFGSIRMAVEGVSARWMKASKALKKEDQIYGQMIEKMAKKHSAKHSIALMIR